MMDTIDLTELEVNSQEEGQTSVTQATETEVEAVIESEPIIQDEVADVVAGNETQASAVPASLSGLGRGMDPRASIISRFSSIIAMLHQTVSTKWNNWLGEDKYFFVQPSVAAQEKSILPQLSHIKNSKLESKITLATVSPKMKKETSLEAKVQ